MNTSHRTHLCNTLLIGPHGSNHTQGPAIDLPPSITNNTHHHLLPPLLTPRLAPIPLAQVGNVLDDAMHSPTKQVLFLVVHRHHDEELRPARRVIVHLAKGEPIVFKVVGVAGGGGVPHVREFALVPVRTHLQELGGDGVVKHEIPVEESMKKKKKS